MVFRALGSENAHGYVPHDTKAAQAALSQASKEWLAISRACGPAQVSITKDSLASAPRWLALRPTVTKLKLGSIYLKSWQHIDDDTGPEEVPKAVHGSSAPLSAYSWGLSKEQKEERKEKLLTVLPQLQNLHLIPRKYIVVQGAHDLAMEDAGIHEFNLVQYTSILPPEAEEVSMDEAKKMPGWHHGAVLECIMSEVQGARGDRITAGVGRMMVHSKSNKGDVMGGFATEYKGHATPDLAEKELKDALEELFERRFSPKDHEMGEKKYDVVSRVVEDAFGVAMAGVCFLDYIFPEVERHAETLAEL
ncbi:hypothetical protein ABPG75_009510 [Micractinium tetrahymenae]